uniref:Uncharacterized protein n=1 Tax=Heterorhabditis bacteriophora TaxID=37862 RepID=A0A1I7W7R0_HETBA
MIKKYYYQIQRETTVCIYVIVRTVIFNYKLSRKNENG